MLMIISWAFYFTLPFYFFIYIDPTHKASVQFYHQWCVVSKRIFLFRGKRERERGTMVVIISCAYYFTLPFYILFFYVYRSNTQGKRAILPSMACRFEAYLFIPWDEGTGERKNGRDYFVSVLLYFTFLCFIFLIYIDLNTRQMKKCIVHRVRIKVNGKLEGKQ